MLDQAIPADAILSWTGDLVALTMSRQVGTCLHFTLVSEGHGSLGTRSELYCAAKESTRVGGKDVQTCRYEQSRFDAISDHWWITSDNRVVKAEYGGPIAELTTKDDALKNLPAGVSGKLD